MVVSTLPGAGSRYRGKVRTRRAIAAGRLPRPAEPAGSPGQVPYDRAARRGERGETLAPVLPGLRRAGDRLGGRGRGVTRALPGLRRVGDRLGGRSRGERGETLALLVVWPALITAILLMLVHAFIVTNARAEAELAASEGLRAAWRAAADSDFLTEPGSSPPTGYVADDPHPEVVEMARAAEDAVARAAATEGGWRWWTPGVAQMYSDWCEDYTPPATPRDPSLVYGDYRPFAGETGWVRVVVSGEVFGPLAALWPGRWDRIHAAAQGPALLVPPAGDERSTAVPVDLEPC